MCKKIRQSVELICNWKTISVYWYWHIGIGIHHGYCQCLWIFFVFIQVCPMRKKKSENVLKDRCIYHIAIQCIKYSIVGNTFRPLNFCNKMMMITVDWFKFLLFCRLFNTNCNFFLFAGYNPWKIVEWWTFNCFIEHSHITLTMWDKWDK